jgi:uncharacterized protein
VGTAIEAPTGPAAGPSPRAASLKYFALFYDVADGFAEKRAPFREDHLRLIREAYARGEIVMAGALGDPPEGALLVFRAPSSVVAEEFARQDPYVRQRLVVTWRVKPWLVVVEPLEPL